jgi:hypothetical protein
VLVQRGREVALAERGDDHDDVLAGGLGTRRDLQRSPDRRARRDADEDALGGRDLAGDADRVVELDVDDLVDDVLVEDLRDEVRTDALDLVRSGVPFVSSGESAGSTAMTLASGTRSLRTWPTPVIVPPVPMPATK